LITFKTLHPLSNSFNVSGLKEPVRVKLNGFSETGHITVGEVRYNVDKYGPASGFWTLERDGLIVLSAEKSSAFKRAFELRNQADLISIVAHSPFTRSFDVIRNGEVVGRIKPNHPFTRKGSIDLDDPNIDTLTIVFVFWLCAMSWRRAQG
jgi:hypothetical protein